VREVGFVGCGHGWVGFGVAGLGRAVGQPVLRRIVGWAGGLVFAAQRGGSVCCALQDGFRAAPPGFRWRATVVPLNRSVVVGRFVYLTHAFASCAVGYRGLVQHWLAAHDASRKHQAAGILLGRLAAFGALGFRA